MDEFTKRLADYFTAAELVELLDIPIHRIIDDIIMEHGFTDDEIVELEEIMEHGCRLV